MGKALLEIGQVSETTQIVSVCHDDVRQGSQRATGRSGLLLSNAGNAALLSPYFPSTASSADVGVV